MAADREHDRDTADEPRWLDADEKDAWTGLISMALLMPGRLEAPLHRAAGLTLFEYMTLSQISEAPGRTIRMSALAYLTNGSLSRLSNVVRRLEHRDLVTRSPDPDDGRYTLAALTDDGYALLAAAAPVHLRAVRELVLDPLTGADRRALARIAAKLRTLPTDYESPGR